MKKILLAGLISSVLLSACGKEELPQVVVPVVVPAQPLAERPNFNINVDEEDAFDKALGLVEGEGEAQFIEVIDDLDADSVQAADPGEKLATALEIDAVAVVESRARGVARAQRVANNTKSGLEFRPYSEEFYTQVKGVRPAILYFTAADCAICANWETNLRAEATAFTDKNALVMMVDYQEETDLVAAMNIPEPGWAMMLTGIGELMGPRPTDRLSKDELLFIFP